MLLQIDKIIPLQKNNSLRVRITKNNEGLFVNTIHNSLDEKRVPVTEPEILDAVNKIEDPFEILIRYRRETENGKNDKFTLFVELTSLEHDLMIQIPKGVIDLSSEEIQDLLIKDKHPTMETLRILPEHSSMAHEASKTFLLNYRVSTQYCPNNENVIFTFYQNGQTIIAVSIPFKYFNNF